MRCASCSQHYPTAMPRALRSALCLVMQETLAQHVVGAVALGSGSDPNSDGGEDAANAMLARLRASGTLAGAANDEAVGQADVDAESGAQSYPSAHKDDKWPT